MCKRYSTTKKVRHFIARAITNRINIAIATYVHTYPYTLCIYVRTFTGHPVFTELVARAAPALEPSWGVRAHITAVVGALEALINICKWVYIRIIYILYIYFIFSKPIIALEY